MNIEKLFRNLSTNKELIFYLFEHRDKLVLVDEVEDFCKDSTLDILENFEIIELSEDKIFLDGRVINFLEEYIDGNDNIEISVISEKITNLKHYIEILKEHKNKQITLIPKIRRELKKVDFILLQNLDKLRIHVDRVYKSIELFSLKIKELQYYKSKLDELSNALNEFNNFLFLHHSILKSFYNSELNIILEYINENKINLNKSLIPLTQDVIEYINQTEQRNIFIEKVAKLKELKDSLELKQKTNIRMLIDEFDAKDDSIKITTRLDGEILTSEHFKVLIEKVSSKAKLKTKETTPINFHDKTIEKEFINISWINLQFHSSKLSLIEFLLNDNSIKQKSIDEISELYCRMILLYEDEYKIDTDTIKYHDITFRKVYYDNKLG